MVTVLAAVSLVLTADVPVAGEGRAPGDAAGRAGRPIDRRPVIITAVATSRPVVALTFDDGPDPRWTPVVLEELRRAGARATFFVTGAQARAHPQLLRDIVASGSEIANHTDTHPQMERLDAAATAAEVAGASFAIGAAGVPQAPYFRPPRGRYGTTTLTAAATAGFLPVGWTVCLERWLRGQKPQEGAEAAADAVRAGGILLAHDGGIPDRGSTVRALPAFLDRLTARGYAIVTISELLPLGSPVHARPGVDPRDAPLTRSGSRSMR